MSAHLCASRATAFFVQGDVDHAIVDYERAAPLMCQADRLWEAAVSLNNLGFLLARKRRLNKGDVVFAVGLTGGQSDSGIFLDSENQINKIMAEGDSTPVGGEFSTLSDSSFLLPRINDAGAVAFRVNIAGGNTGSAIFLASPRAIFKVVAVGDRLPTGEKIRAIDTFALNDLGQVAFFAYGTKAKTKPLGVYAASPLVPTISKIKLKHKSSGFELRVSGNGMITNDTVIEINGMALQDLRYPSDFQENGGTTTRVVSRDARLEQLIPEGRAIQVTVYNSLTNLRGVPKGFTR